MNVLPSNAGIKTVARDLLSWTEPLLFPALQATDIHLWAWSLRIAAEPLTVLRRVLAIEETERAERFVFDRHRECFIVARGRMRQLLGSYLGTRPDRLRFRANRYGKPELQEHPCLRFNLTHSGDMAILAVADNIELGVDIEFIRPFSGSIAQNFFTEGERRFIEERPAHDRLRAFYSCWTGKEAFLKGLGIGLSGDLSSFSVSIAAHGSALRASLVGPQTEGWILEQLFPGPGYIGAIAYRNHRPCAISRFALSQSNSHE